MKQVRMSAGILAGAFFCVTSPCSAFQLSDGWTANTFASMAVLSSNENDFNTRTDDHYSLDFAEAGVTLSGDVFDATRVAAQLLSRKFGQMDEGDPRVDFAYVQQTFFDNESGNGAVRIGRVKRPIGLDSEMRDVAFARTSVLSSQTMIFDFARNAVLSQNGALLVTNWNTFSHQFTFEFSEAYPRTDSDDLELILGFSNGALKSHDMSGKADGKLSPAYRLSWEWIDQNLRVVFGNARLTYAFEFNDERFFTSGDVVMTAKTLGLQKNLGSWILSTEYLDARVEYRDMPPLPEVAPAFSYVYQALYHFSPRVYGVVRHENTYVLKNDRDGREIEAMLANTPYAIEHFRFFSKETTLGVTWQTTPNVLLRGEIHFFNGASLAKAEQPSAFEKDWRLYALQLAVRF